METPELASADYWESDSIDIRLNPRRNIDATGLLEFLEKECGVRSTVVMATSGSSGGFKFALLSKAALLASARAVVAHCGMGKDDIWLAGLSDFHVGGLGIYARAYVAGSRVVPLTNFRWNRDGAPFLEAIRRSGATLTSMTPTHLHDLVRAEASSPESLRGVLLGGGLIDPVLIEHARGLGWKIWPSYGMTEACSQIATSVEGESEWLPILSHWNCRILGDGRLAIRGESLFSGYAVKRDCQWQFGAGPDEEGWFVTGDRCDLVEGRLKFLGRSDDLVKISGELVSLSAIENTAKTVAEDLGVEAAVVAVPNPRRENELVVLIEENTVEASRILQELNHELEGIEQVSRAILIPRMPRTEIGKVDRDALRRLAMDSGR